MHLQSEAFYLDDILQGYVLQVQCSTENDDGNDNDNDNDNDNNKVKSNVRNRKDLTAYFQAT
jgi:hypothetical protein